MDITLQECQRSFESLRAVKEVSCFRTHYQITWHTTYTVQFKKWITDAPYETNFYTNDGNPPLSAFSCTSKDAKSGRRTKVDCTLSVANYHNDVPPSYTYCSNRGVCNLLTGTCKCNPGYTNANCDTYLTHGDLFVLKSKAVLSITSRYSTVLMYADVWCSHFFLEPLPAPSHDFPLFPSFPIPSNNTFSPLPSPIPTFFAAMKTTPSHPSSQKMS